VGRLSREKGTWDLLEVASRVLAAVPDVEFRLAGLGETEREEAALRAAAHRGPGERVRFLGLLGEDDLRREYGAAHVFLLPSHAEIFPVVLLEAMAAGLPLVTTDTGAIPEMFTEGREGFRHAVGDVEGMAASLRRLLTDPELRGRGSAAARELAARRYRAEDGAARVAAILEDVAARRPVTPSRDW
jgi:glycosyltransferase involved in cell wall biosynthesis